MGAIHRTCNEQSATRPNVRSGVMSSAARDPTQTSVSMSCAQQDFKVSTTQQRECAYSLPNHLLNERLDRPDLYAATTVFR